MIRSPANARWQRTAAIVLVLGLVLLVAATPHPVQPAERAATTWVSHTNTNDVNGLAFDGSTLWAATTGGAVRWDTATGSYDILTFDDGLAGSYVYSTIVDPDGNRWFGTSRGLSRLAPGGTWTTYTTADGLVSDRAEVLGIDSLGRVYAGTSASLARFDGTHWTPYTDARDGILANYAAIVPGPQRGYAWTVEPPDKVWTNLGPFVGAQVTDGLGWTGYDHTNGLASDYVDAIAVDAGGWVWFAHEGGVTRQAGTEWTHFDAANSGLLPGVVGALAVGPDNRKWFGVTDCTGECAGGISTLDDHHTLPTGDDVWTTYRASSGLPGEDVRDIVFGPGGTPWAATGRGLAKLGAGGWLPFRTAGLPGNQVEAALVEPDGGVWAGTSGGVAQWNGLSWTTHDAGSAGFVADAVHALARGTDGRIWVGIGEQVSGGAHGELAAWNGRLWTHFIRPESSVQAVVTQMSGSTQVVWAGTAAYASNVGRLLALVSDTYWVEYQPTVTGVTQLAPVNAIAVDAAGNKWLGTDDGLYVFSDGGTPFATFDDRWQRRTVADGLVSSRVLAVAVDGQGQVWAATPLGASMLRTGDDPFFKPQDWWRTYTPRNSGLADPFVRAITFEAGGTWFGTNAGASYLASDGSWTTISQAGGLTDDQVTTIAVASNGDRWFGTWRGGLSQMVVNPPPVTPTSSPTQTPEPTATPTSTATVTPTASSSATPTASATHTATPSPAVSATPTASPSPTATPTHAEASPTNTSTPVSSATSTPTAPPTPSLTATATPIAGTATPSPTRLATPPLSWTATRPAPVPRLFLPVIERR